LKLVMGTWRLMVRGVGVMRDARWVREGEGRRRRSDLWLIVIGAVMESELAEMESDCGEMENYFWRTPNGMRDT